MERMLAWDDGAVVAIDQCALPAVYRTLRLTSVDDVIDAIVRLAIRGAPRGRLQRPEEIASVEWWLTGEPAVPLHGAVIDASMGLGVRAGLPSQDAAAPVKEVP